MGSKAALVDQVKAIQRTSQEARIAWQTYSDTNLGGVKDPNRHEEHTLLDFITQYQAGAISVPPGGCGAPLRPAPVVGGWTPSAPTAWGTVGAVGGGKGCGKDGGKGGGKGNIGLLFKEGQKKSQRWREAWQKYCAVYGNGFNDPTRHPEDFINGFMDYLGGLASGDLDGQAAKQGVDFEDRGIKRAGAEGPAWMPPAKYPALASGMDPEKAELVDKVKGLQRSSPAVKEAWGAFCDDSCGGVRDPARHDASLLRVFLEGQGVA